MLTTSTRSETLRHATRAVNFVKPAAFRTGRTLARISLFTSRLSTSLLDGLTTCRSAANAKVALERTTAARSGGRSPRRRGMSYVRPWGVAFVCCNGLLAGDHRREYLRRRMEERSKPTKDGVIVGNDVPVQAIRLVLVQRLRGFQQPADGSQREELEAGDRVANLVEREDFESMVNPAVHHESVGIQQRRERSVPFARGCTARLNRGTVPHAGFDGKIHGHDVRLTILPFSGGRTRERSDRRARPTATAG